MLVELCAAFAQDPAEDTVTAGLAELARVLEVDQIALLELPADGSASSPRHSCSRVDHAAIALSGGEYAWLADRYRAGSTVAWSRIPEEIPYAAAAERADALRMGLKSFLAIPVVGGPEVCIATFARLLDHRPWPEGLQRRLRLLANAFASHVAHRRAAEALEASESRYRAMLRALPDLMVVLDQEGVYLECHLTSRSELLAPPAQYLGRRMKEVVGPELAELFRAAAERAAGSGEVVEVEYTVWIGGESHEREARITAREDGATVIIVRNMSERHRALRRLRESEERFRGAFEHSAIGLAIVSPEGRWLKVNRVLCGILGYTEEELLTKDFQAVTHPDGLVRSVCELQRMVAGEVDYCELEKSYVHKDGRQIPVLVTVSVVRDGQGRVLHNVTQVQDLTERQQAQLEIERLRLELAHAGRLALTGQLTGSLAHELMQPLAAMRSNAAAAQIMMASDDAGREEMAAIFEDIVAGSARAAGVIDNIRTLLAKGPTPRIELDLNLLVKQVISVMRHELMLRRVRVTTRLDEALPQVAGNPIELQQVFVNLLVNGAEALSSDACPRRELIVTSSHRHDEVQIAVSDSGCGIDPANLRQIFQPFFSTKAEGTGMGLTISAAIVRAHGGRLWADNNPEGGATLYCALPVKSRATTGRA